MPDAMTTQALANRPANGSAHRRVRVTAGALRQQLAAAVVALLSLKNPALAAAPTDVAKPVDSAIASCEVSVVDQTQRSAACLVMAGELMDKAHRYYLEGDASTAQSYLERAGRISPDDLRLSLEQALVDDASGHPLQARKRYDLLRGTSLEREAAARSAANFAVLGRLDEARKAFTALSGSADDTEAGYAQLWILWLDARTWHGGASALREKLAQNTVGLRAGNAWQQALLNLYAGQGSADAVFAAIKASTSENSPQRRDARAEAAFFAGGYLQYAWGDTEAAKRLYRRELPQSGASAERVLIQQFVDSI